MSVMKLLGFRGICLFLTMLPAGREVELFAKGDLQAAAGGAMVAAINGRVFVNGNPVAGAKVYVEDVRTGRVIANTYSTGSNPGPDSGWYQVTGLPAGKSLSVTAVWKGFNSKPFRVTLKAGQYKWVCLNINARPPK